MARKKKGDPVHGWINLYKPAGVVSTHAVAVVKRAFNAQKAGHAGTLDPLADGLLPIALGEATKTVPYVQDALKIYDFTAKWGQQRSTDDGEGTIIQQSDARPTQAQILDILPQFTGDITQIPPIYSAIRIDGKRAYDIARDMEEDLKTFGTDPKACAQTFEMPERDVYIERFDLKSAEADQAHFECLCGKGTYIRSLVRDIALACDSFGHVGKLTRTKVGPFSIDDAISLDFFENNMHSAQLNEALLPLTAVLDDIPALAVSSAEASLLRNGQFLKLIARHDVTRLTDLGLDTAPTHTTIALAMHDDAPVGLIQIKGISIKPERLFNI